MVERIIDKIEHLYFDFDGVFTNNKVIFDQFGNEAVVCSRGDSLGISLLKKYCSKYHYNLDIAVISTEKNPVVNKRCQKMGIKNFQGIEEKLLAVQNLIKSNNLEKTCFVGNDLNDYKVMLEAGFSYCPKDSHPLIKKISKKILPFNGGEGFVRGVVEDIIEPFDLELI